MMGTTEKRILEFRELEPGWHYGEGGPASETAIENAIRLDKQVHSLGYIPTNCFPGVSGEVMLTVYYLQHYLEFTCGADGTVVVVEEYGEEELSYVEGMSLQAAEAKLRECWARWSHKS